MSAFSSSITWFAHTIASKRFMDYYWLLWMFIPQIANFTISPFIVLTSKKGVKNIKIKMQKMLHLLGSCWLKCEFCIYIHQSALQHTHTAEPSGITTSSRYYLDLTLVWVHLAILIHASCLLFDSTRLRITLSLSCCLAPSYFPTSFTSAATKKRTGAFFDGVDFQFCWNNFHDLWPGCKSALPESIVDTRQGFDSPGWSVV